MLKKIFNKTFKKYADFQKKERKQCKELGVSEKNRINRLVEEEEIFYNQVSKVNCSDELNKSDDELISNVINELSSNKSTNESNSIESTESIYSNMPCESQVNEILNQKMSKDKSIDTFTKSINVSNISRRRIIANMDYEVDNQFMCSTLLKEEDKSKPKFDVDVCDSSESNQSNDQKIMSNKLSSDFKQANLQLVDNRFFKSKKISNEKSSHKTSTLLINKSSKNTNRLDQEEPIYDPRKPFSDLSSIEEAKLDYMNNLKNTQFNSINKRNSQYLNQFKNAKFDSIDRNSMINDQKYRKMHNYFNDNQNYPSDYYDEDAWFCKTKLYEDHLDEIIKKWSHLDNEVWGKLIYLERNRRIAKAYIRLPYLIVTGNQSGFDGYSIGLNGFENMYRDQETEYIVKNLEKGVRIKIDENGNLIFRKMCQLSVQVKDWLQQLTVDGSGSLSDDIIALHGKLPYNQPIKVFDIDRFANNLRKELEKPIPNRRLLARQCILPICFGKNTYSLFNSPCWTLLINLVGLRMIDHMNKIQIPDPDYGLPIDDLKEEEEESTGSSSNNNLSSDGSSSMTNSEEDNQFYRFTRNKKNVVNHIYSSI